MQKSALQDLLAVAAIILIGVFFLTSFFSLNRPDYLTFSDGAKFADIARNLNRGEGFELDFLFFGRDIYERVLSPENAAKGVFPAMPYAISYFFKIFGTNDLAVIYTSSFFFLALLVVTYFLGKRLYGTFTGLLSAVVLTANINLLDYATSGASEITFSLEIVLATYLISIKRRWAAVLSFIVLLSMIYTRPQYALFIPLILIFGLAVWFGLEKTLKYSVATAVVIFLGDLLLYKSIFGRSFFYPLVSRALPALYHYAPGEPTSLELRGVATDSLRSFGAIASKLFWNLYNFYRFLPRIFSYFLVTLLFFGIFKKSETKKQEYFKYLTLISVLGIIVFSAATIPLFRYMHPVIPLLVIFSVATLNHILGDLIGDEEITVKFLSREFSVGKSAAANLGSLLLVIVFTITSTLGVIFLDSRSVNINKEQPPIYQVFAEKLKEDTGANSIIVTNLDTWGTWYGDRTTVWYPTEPGQLVSPEGEMPFDAIYLTSYLIDDENYYMGEEWRKILLNPQEIENETIGEYFKVEKSYIINQSETYENINGAAILLVKK